MTTDQRTLALQHLATTYNSRTGIEAAIESAARRCHDLGIPAETAARHLGVHRTTISRLYKRATGEEQ